MPEDPIAVLDASDDPKTLQGAALTLARSGKPGDHGELARRLALESFLLRLDTAKAYEGLPDSLRLRRVLEGLRTNETPSAGEALVALTRAPVFRDESGREELLIRALDSVRPSPPEAIAYWDDHSQPDDGVTLKTIEALLNNGSPPALALFERKVLDPAHPLEDKTAWFRGYVLLHRNDVPLLETCESLIRNASLDEDVRRSLAEALFDYRPAEWFRPATFVNPPPRSALDFEGRAVLRRLGEWLLASKLPSETQRKVIEGVLEEIRERE